MRASDGFVMSNDTPYSLPAVDVPTTSRISLPSSKSHVPVDATTPSETAVPLMVIGPDTGPAAGVSTAELPTSLPLSWVMVIFCWMLATRGVAVANVTEIVFVSHGNALLCSIVPLRILGWRSRNGNASPGWTGWTEFSTAGIVEPRVLMASWTMIARGMLAGLHMLFRIRLARTHGLSCKCLQKGLSMLNWNENSCPAPMPAPSSENTIFPYSGSKKPYPTASAKPADAGSGLALSLSCALRQV